MREAYAACLTVTDISQLSALDSLHNLLYS
jgi:hypothetical protein